jgi:hypothetical protein
MVACIDFFEMSEICRPKFIVRHSTSDRMNSIVDFANIIETYQYVLSRPKYFGRRCDINDIQL